MGRRRSRRTTSASAVNDAATPRLNYSDPCPLCPAFLVYVRSSTPAQDESCEQQIQIAERDLRKLGLLPPGATLPRHHAPEAGVYVDDGVSAWKKRPRERPGARQLLERIQRERRLAGQEPGVLWVWAQSRLLRTKTGAAAAVKEIVEIREHGWVLHTHREGRLDVFGEDGFAKTFQIALSGEKDSEHSREKEESVRRNKELRIRAGLWIGGFAPFGYDRWAVRLGDADPLTGRRRIVEWVELLPHGRQNPYPGLVTVLRPSAEWAKHVRRAFALAADGEDGYVVPTVEITRRFNDLGLPTGEPAARRRVRRQRRAEKEGRKAPSNEEQPPRWGRTSVHELLTNEAYRGIQRDADGNPHEALWEPLVDAATWARVEARFVASAAQPRSVNSCFALSGLLHCAQCSERLTGERSKRRASSGGHLDYYRRSPSDTRDEPCPACRRRIPAEAIEDTVLDLVAELADHPLVRRAVAAERAARAAGAESVAERRDALAAEAADLGRQIDTLVRLLAKGGAVAKSADAQLDALNAAAKRVERQRQALDVGTEAAAEQNGVAPAFAAHAAGFRAIWAHAGPAERREALRQFVVRVDVDGLLRTVHVGVRPLSQAVA